MESGFIIEEGDGLLVLTRALGVSEEFFTRAKEFVPERLAKGTPVVDDNGPPLAAFDDVTPPGKSTTSFFRTVSLF